jgi:DNA primase large subunit
MDNSDSVAVQALKEEFRRLVEQQERLLKKSVFGGMTPEEANEYDERQRRIRKLVERLTALE